MRLLDTYALPCGAKIDEPFLMESYFPLPIENYITFQAQSKFESKDYDYWQATINILAPILEVHGIKIIQIGGNNEIAYQRVIDLRGQTNVHQLSYVIKRAKLHLGPDSLAVHIASALDVPLVGLYSISAAEVSGPHFGDKSKQILFKGYERVGNGKPSYAAKENPKSINSIKPEEICDAVFKLLGLNFVTPFTTVHIGNRYSSNILREMVPDTNISVSNPEAPVEIRADIALDVPVLMRQLSYLQKAVLITDKPIDMKLLKKFKRTLAMLVYRITEEDHPEFVREAISAGFQVLLVTRLSPEELAPKKIKYYEFGKIHALPKPPEDVVEKLRADMDSLYYHSCKLITSKGKMFASHAAREIGQDLKNDHEYTKVIDSPSFWNDLDFYILVRKHKDYERNDMPAAQKV